MTEQDTHDEAAGGDYDVVLLVEQQLSATDAQQVCSLHADVAEPVRYHLVLPVEDAAARVEAAMGSLTDDAAPAARTPTAPADEQAGREEAEHRSATTLDASAEALHAAGGGTATRRAVDGDPVDALAAVVAEVDGREAIVLTRPHLVRELLRLDWSSRARRALGVPVLHLLEQESFDEQAGGPEGVTGL